MANEYYLGRDPELVLGDSPLYFYGLRRNDDGELFLIKSDQLRGKDDEIFINLPGDPSDNYDGFSVGTDYVEGIDVNHAQLKANQYYPQYRWDDRALYYYVDSNGNLTVRVNRNYEYPEGISSNG